MTKSKISYAQPTPPSTEKTTQSGTKKRKKNRSNLNLVSSNVEESSKNASKAVSSSMQQLSATTTSHELKNINPFVILKSQVNIKAIVPEDSIHLSGPAAPFKYQDHFSLYNNLLMLHKVVDCHSNALVLVQLCHPLGNSHDKDIAITLCRTSLPLCCFNEVGFISEPVADLKDSKDLCGRKVEEDESRQNIVDLGIKVKLILFNHPL